MEQRAQVRREEPLCRKCLERDVTSATEVVDHIINLADPSWRRPGAGDPNARSNLQGLCTPCHDAKTAAEAVAGRLD